MIDGRLNGQFLSERGRLRQAVLLVRLHGLRGERKVDFVDSRTRLGNAQTSLTLHSLLPRLFGATPQCAWSGGGLLIDGFTELQNYRI